MHAINHCKMKSGKEIKLSLNLTPPFLTSHAALFILLGHQASIWSEQTFTLLTHDLKNVLELNTTSGHLAIMVSAPVPHYTLTLSY